MKDFNYVNVKIFVTNNLTKNAKDTKLSNLEVKLKELFLQFSN